MTNPEVIKAIQQNNHAQSLQALVDNGYMTQEEANREVAENIRREDDKE